MTLFPESSFKLKLAAFLTGAAGVFVLFLIIPFIQMVHVERSHELLLESDMVMPRNKQPVQCATQSAQISEPERQPPAPMEEMMPVLETRLLDLELHPVLDSASVTDFRNDILEQLLQQAGDYTRILSFEELAYAPSILHLPEIQFPDALLRQDIREGEVVVTILIDEEGRAECERIESCSHPLLETLVRSVVRKTRFSVSLVEGRPVKVRGTWPLMLRAPG